MLLLLAATKPPLRIGYEGAAAPSFIPGANCEICSCPEEADSRFLLFVGDLILRT